MKIKEVMTKDPITVNSETLVSDALKIMEQNNIRWLPVVDKGKLIGIAAQNDLNEALPQPTSRSKAHDLRFALSRTKVKEVMKKNPVTLNEDTPFEEYLRILQERKGSVFPVISENGQLVGITTETDIIRVLNRILGLGEEGSRITVEGLGGKLGNDLQKIVSIVSKFEVALLSIMSLPRPEKDDSVIVLRLKTKEPGPILNDLKSAGFDVTSAA